MKDFDRIKEWAKTLNTDPVWQAKIDDQCSISGLEEMVCHLTAETGSLNIVGLFALIERDPVIDKIEYMLSVVEPLQFIVRDLEHLVSPDNKEEMEGIKEMVSGLCGYLRNLHCFEKN